MTSGARTRGGGAMKGILGFDGVALLRAAKCRRSTSAHAPRSTRRT